MTMTRCFPIGKGTIRPGCHRAQQPTLYGSVVCSFDEVTGWFVLVGTTTNVGSVLLPVTGPVNKQIIMFDGLGLQQ